MSPSWSLAFSAYCALSNLPNMELPQLPPLSQCRLLPNMQTAQSMMDWNEAYDKQLREWRDQLESWDEDARANIASVICEVWELRDVWYYIRRAQDRDFRVIDRQLALRELQRLVPAADYFSGRFPCAVPLHVFSRND